ncbi:hypothetical protein VN21_13390 [Paraclostridium benzoelyticum]|uniref:Lipoprotein n=1 Tax=Paraclostridium benzoelyticum TaxID=1629550 RepID=A0A0M3DE79_9FIRM|nr:hypothetical protein [Paraclostridium benzoelyticum]KKY00578.1 hypothetical protein VN21_13390 [Paraclostridium benzoelyticum]MDM8128988.1 hypothetical protein [Paraclostridium benzoelyticum]
MKKQIIFILLIISSFTITGCTYTKIPGNTDESIKQYLIGSKLINSPNQEDISIVDNTYIQNSKIVGFLSKYNNGVVICEKNKKGKYILSDIQFSTQKKETLGVENFLVNYNTYNGISKSSKAFVLISDGSKVSRVEITINDTYKCKKSFKPYGPSMIVVNSDVLSKKSSYVNCKYFDKNNNEINQDA